MKRALLIAGGTVGGLGAVLAITPPQITSTQDVSGLTGSLGVGTASARPTAQATSTAPKLAATKATPTKKATAGATASSTATPSATPTVATPSGGYSGTVTGASFNARNYGTLSATVTFSNGKITNVLATQSPRSWSQNSLSVLIPFVNGGKISVEQVKTYAAEQLPCAILNSCRSQASFTATAFWSSVQSAINKAGL